MTNAEAFWNQTFDRHIGPITTSLRAKQPARLPEIVRQCVDESHVIVATRAAVTEVCRVRKLTPLENYVAHRSYPSPRSTFPTNFHDVREDAGHVRATFSIDLERIHSAYGALRKSLALLELGHLWMNLDVALIPYHLTTTKDAPICWNSDSLGEVAFIIEPRHSDVTSFPAEPKLYFDARSSNPPAPNWFDEAIPVSDMEQLLEEFATAAGEVRGHQPVTLVAHTFDADKIMVAEYPAAGGILRSRWAQEQVVDQCRNAVTICMPASGAANIGVTEDTLLGIGRIAQAISLFAGLRGISARPIRALREAQLSAMLRLSLDSVPVYQVRLAPRWRTAFTREMGAW